MKRLLIVYPGFNEEINCTQIIEDEKGFVCYTDQKPLWAKKEKNMTPEDFLMTKGISSDTTIGIEGDYLITDLLKDFAATQLTLKNELAIPDIPDDYYKKNSITPESGVGIQTARCD